MSSTNNDQWRVAVDIGGTFTDFELLHAASGERISHKTATTPEDPSIGLVRGISEVCERVSIDPGQIDGLMHGTTIATNAILEHRFPRAALLTTAGFTDVLEIGRHVRTDVYGQIAESRPNLIPRRYRFGVRERIRGDGTVETALDASDLDDKLDQIAQEKITVIAVCLLHSFANSVHEKKIRAQIKDRIPGAYISVSSDISPEAREYERTATTVLNALLMPVVRDYLDLLRTKLHEADWRFPVYLVQSNGGVTTPDIAREQPVRLVLSGPSGGVRAAEVLSTKLDEPNLVAIDMGGTSFDVSLIDRGKPRLRTNGSVGGFPVRVPMLEMHTIGAGGGSIAKVDEHGRLSVGPASAGATPGPAAYGRGGLLPTITDANIILGRIDPARFLGGAMSLDATAADQAMQQYVAEPLGLDLLQAASGVIQIAVNHMASAIRLALFEKGLDPRDFAMMSFGGAGGLHAVQVAEELGATRIFFPEQCGTLSAWGMLHADISHDLSQTHLCPADAESVERLDHVCQTLLVEGGHLLDRADVDEDARHYVIAFDMRYKGQAWEIQVPLDDGLDNGAVTQRTIEFACKSFHQRHLDQFMHNDSDVIPEIVTVRVRAVGHLDRPHSQESGDVQLEAPATEREVYLNNKMTNCSVFDRRSLKSSDRLLGPCVIEEPHSTLVLPAGWSATVREDGTLSAEQQASELPTQTVASISV